MRTTEVSNRRIAVFCGARPGSDPGHLRFAREFGTALAQRGLELVYGTGGGVMGALAEAVAAAGSGITGIVPHSLREQQNADSPRGTIFVVRSLHERKALMYRLCSAFAVLPGGIGTLDELMEVATWNNLCLMDKPIVVVNHLGFFDPMLEMLDHLVRQGFLTREERRLIQVAQSPDEAFDLLRIGVPEPGTV
ncbi:TIGR00730 family Rossman fold protein [Actinomadura rubrisoli]|nr:TIGR00730 family Rossman fold protein [Actinomadura rubrisoli]